MKKILALLALSSIALGITATSAFAHGPTPQKVEKSIVIKADPAKVWALVKDFGNMQKWHPAVTATKLSTKGTDTYRALSLKGGGVINERLRSSDDASMKLKYEIVDSPLPLTDYNSTLSVSKGPGAGETTVTWVGRFYRLYKLNPPIPQGQDDETATATVVGIYDSGLANLKKVAEASK